MAIHKVANDITRALNDGDTIGALSTDKVGFYGKTPVAQAAALTAASAAASDTNGTAGFAAAGDRTALVNLVNNLRTRLIEVETILSNLGLSA